jgi:hypothetical protein
MLHTFQHFFACETLFVQLLNSGKFVKPQVGVSAEETRSTDTTLHRQATNWFPHDCRDNSNYTHGDGRTLQAPYNEPMTDKIIVKRKTSSLKMSFQVTFPPLQAWLCKYVT